MTRPGFLSLKGSRSPAVPFPESDDGPRPPLPPLRPTAPAGCPPRHLPRLPAPCRARAGSDAAPLDTSDGDEVTIGFESDHPGRGARGPGTLDRLDPPRPAPRHRRRRPRRRRDQAVVARDAAPAERGDRYQLLGEIARGGMGAVLKGRDPDLGRDLAVKVLLEAHRDNPELVRRFVEEAQIGGQLQHPGIVPVYELGTFADRRPYFTMKLVKGRTLAALLSERADPPRTTCRGSWASSSRSARRWPTPTPAA